MKRVLVTGATGFVGNHVINELLTRNYQVIASSTNRDTAKFKSWYPKVDYVPFDLNKMVPGNNYFEYFKKPDSLIHLAWEGLPNYKSTFHLEENLPKHFAFLENLIQNGLIDLSVIGTCFEYGMQEGMLSEDMISLPSNPYAEAKDRLRVRLSEMALTKSVNFKWIRLFYMYGPGQRANSLLSQLQAALDRGDDVFNMSPGDQLRDYLKVKEVAEYIVRIAMQQKVTGVINCCSGQPIRVKDLVSDYLLANNGSIRLNFGYYPYSDYEPLNFWGDTRKMKNILENE